MRLCFISNPNSTHTRRWVNWFAGRGHTVCLIADNRLEQPWPGLPIHDLPARLGVPVLKYIAWMFWTRQIVRRWQPDILHAHRVSGAGWLGAFAGFHPLVVTPWGSDLYQLPASSSLLRWLASYVLKRADLVTADSADLRREAVRYGARTERTHLVQWGVDQQIFHPQGDTAPLRERLRLGVAPVVLSPRGVRSIYNLETIVEAMAQIRATVPNAVLILRDYNTDPAYKAAVQALIAHLELVEAVRWVGLLERYEDAVDLYRLADVVVSVPSSDGTPVSVLEAMACGAAIVASDLPSLREWIVDGENGLLVPVGDAGALAAAVVALLRDPGWRATLGWGNVELVRQRANHGAEMEKMEGLYRSLLPGQG